MTNDININDITFGDPKPDSAPTHTTPTHTTPNVGTFEPVQPANDQVGSFWDDAAEGGDFEDLKPGTYDVTIKEAGLKEYKNGGRGFELITKLTSNGQQDWTYFTFEHSNQSVVGMGKRDLKNLFTAFGLTLPEDLNSMLALLKSLTGRTAKLSITWNRKKEFDTVDAIGNQTISADYNAENVEHHYVNKSIKPA